MASSQALLQCRGLLTRLVMQGCWISNSCRSVCLLLHIPLFLQLVPFEGITKNPDMKRVLVTHEVICR